MCTLLASRRRRLHRNRCRTRGAFALLSLILAASLPARDVLVDLGSSWSFFRGRTPPSDPDPTAWRNPGFSDAAWERGDTGIGYGDDDDATVLEDMQNGYLTLYARKTFDVADPARISLLLLTIDFDDGFVCYINGKKPVPEDWLLDHQGRPTTDPSVLYEPPLGSILPMGGSQAYKGFGLGLVLDMLAGGLTGGRSSHRDAPPVRGNNVVFLALDPRFFAGRDALVRESTQLCEYVRSTPRAPGVESILLPGDPERWTFQHRSERFQ